VDFLFSYQISMNVWVQRRWVCILFRIITRNYNISSEHIKKQKFVFLPLCDLVQGKENSEDKKSFSVEFRNVQMKDEIASCYYLEVEIVRQQKTKSIVQVEITLLSTWRN
jgi:hypothetical protein